MKKIRVFGMFSANYIGSRTGLVPLNELQVNNLRQQAPEVV